MPAPQAPLELSKSWELCEGLAPCELHASLAPCEALETRASCEAREPQGALEPLGSPARIMIAALHGSSGKTVISLGILRALSARGLVVQPFKKGPDFIDPGWHRAACRRVSRNLDRFFFTPAQLCAVLRQSSQGSELSLIEGAMGLFDGADAAGSCSCAEIAKLSATPVVLVIDCTRMTRTAAALVLGCQHFDPELTIAGVILNRVRGQRHEELIRATIEERCGIPVIGALPSDNRLLIASRHLGLNSSEGTSSAKREQLLNDIAELVAQHLDLAHLLALAHTAGPLPGEELAPAALQTYGSAEPVPGKPTPSKPVLSKPLPGEGLTPPALQPCNAAAPLPHALEHTSCLFSQRAAGEDAPRIGVLKDPAFCFYYEENLAALREQGAKLVFINSLESIALPPKLCGLYIGGGFPELYAAALSANDSLRAHIKEHIEGNLPVYAECGGLMYLGAALEYEGHTYDMVGALGFTTSMQPQREAHGYSVLEATQAHPWLEPGTVLLGHEFHHSKILGLEPGLSFGYTNQRGHGINGTHDGLCYKGVVASYCHVNALASPGWAAGFVKQARAYCHQARNEFCLEKPVSATLAV